MSGALRNWIPSTVGAAVEAAVKCLDGKDNVGGAQDRSHLTRLPDGLTIHLTKPRCCQIIKLSRQSSGFFDTTLSDGTTLIQATFARQGIEIFQKESGRDLAGLSGAIIGVKDYYLVFDSVTPQPRMLTLNITDFTLIGSEGSKVFGKPSDIMSLPRIQEVLARLTNIFTSTKDTGRQDDNAPSTRSPLEIIPSGSPQQGFATQVERRTGETERPQAPQFKEVAPAYNPLLNLLKMLKVPKPPAASKSTVLAESSDVLNSITEKGKISNSPKDSVSKISTKLDASASKNQPAFAKSPKSTQSNVPATRTFQQAEEKTARSPRPSSEGFENRHVESSPECGLSALQETKNEQVPQSRKEIQEQDLSLSHAEELQFKRPFLDPFLVENPFSGLKRIPRHYVRISEAQRHILEKDSWYEPPQDGKASYALLPSKVRDDIVAFIESQRRTTHTHSQQSKPSDIEDQDQDDEVESMMSVDAVSDIMDKHYSESNVHHTKSQMLISIDTGKDPQHESQHIILENDQGSNQSSQGEFSRSSYEDAEEHHKPFIAQRERKSPTVSVTGSVRLEQPRAEPYRYQRVHVTIPPSSPVEEDQIELAVPHALGDIVDSDSEMENLPVLPPIAQENSFVVQVEHTPYANSRHKLNAETRQLEAFNEPSSDPIIPATFRDPDFQTPSSWITEERNMERMAGQLPLGTQAVDCNTSPAPVNVNLLRGANVDNEVVKEIQKTQHKPGGIQQNVTRSRQSSVDYPEAPPSELYRQLQVLDGPPLARHEQRRSEGSEASMSPNRSMSWESNHSADMIIYSPPRAPGLGDDEDSLPSNRLSEAGNKKRKSDALGKISSLRSSRRRLRASAAAILKEEECPPLDPKEMARLSRQNFDALIAKEMTLPVDIPTTKPRGHPPAFPVRQITPLTIDEDMQASSQKALQLGKFSLDDAAPVEALNVLPSMRENEEIVSSTQSCKSTRTPSTEPSPSSPALQVPQTIPFALEEQANPSSPLSSEIVKSSPSAEPVLEVGNEQVAVPPSQNTFRPISSRKSESPTPSLIPSSIPSALRTIGACQQSRLARDFEVGGSYTQPWETSFWDIFKINYSDYPGNEKNFTMALVYIEWLTRDRQLIPSHLYDDFIRVYATDFLEYLRKCNSTGTKATLKGREFYEKNVPTPEYDDELITPENLQEAILSLDPEKVSKYRASFKRGMIKAPQESASQSVPQLHSLEQSGKNLDGQQTTEATVSVPLNRTGTRKPFFETASQLFSAKRKEQSSIPEGSEAEHPENEHHSKRPRILPWSSPQNVTVESPISTSSQVQKGSTLPEAKQPRHVQPPTGSHSTQNLLEHSGLSSPQEPSPLPEKPPVKAIPAPQSSVRKAKPLSTDNPTTTLHRVSGLSGEGQAGEPSSVQGWLNDIPKPRPISFKEMIQNKRRSGGFTSRNSTPNTTPTRRFGAKTEKLAGPERG